MNTLNHYNILKRPLITEKSTIAVSQGKVVFLVDRDATKHQIADAMKTVFKAEVVDVNTINVKGKRKMFRGRPGQRQSFKKAVITLKPGTNIDFAHGV